ncbi:hypothetical protein MRX96_058691 [Rhipicephalus microplus]
MPQSILQDPLLLTRLKWSEIVDVLCLEVLGETRCDPLSMRGLLDIDAIDSGVFRTYFRFEKDDVPRLRRALCIPDKAVHAKGAPLTNCGAFIDGTARPICRPTRNQKVYFSGHKRVHALKYQAIMCPNGIICQLDGSYHGSKHDSGNFGNSAAYTKLQNLVQGHDYCIYRSKTYPLRPLLLKPYGGALLTPEQLAFNKAMSSVSQYFGLEPPQLEVYLAHK